MAARMATPDLGKRRSEIQKHVRAILELIGEDPNREGLLSTPKRVAEAYAELSAGYHADLEKVLNKAIFHEDCSEMILVKDIELYSLCEHHMLPFVGRAHVAYIPNGKIVGLSKIPRIVDVFARRLQVQERLTTQVAQAIECFLQPLGVGVVIEAAHYCMMMRGVQKQNSVAITSCMLGQMRDDSRSRMEFLNLLGHTSLKG